MFITSAKPCSSIPTSNVMPTPQATVTNALSVQGDLPVHTFHPFTSDGHLGSRIVAAVGNGAVHSFYVYIHSVFLGLYLGVPAIIT